MADHREANSANEAGNGTGVELTKGGEQLAHDDLLRSAWLDEHVDFYVRQARRRRQMMRIVREPA